MLVVLWFPSENEKYIDWIVKTFSNNNLWIFMTMLMFILGGGLVHM